MYRISVIVATMHRPKELARCLRSVMGQSRPPDEIVIVDDGRLDQAELRSLVPHAIEFQYHRKQPPGLSASRNLGAKMAKGDLLLFLDDDVVLEDRFIEEIIRVFQGDERGEIGGVGGVIVNRRAKPAAFHLWARAFFLHRGYEGEVLPWGFYTRVSTPKDILEVDWIPGGLSCFRKEVFNEFQLSDMGQLGRHGLADVEFSCRVRGKYRLFVTPFARLRHFPSERSREASFMTGYKQALGHFQLFALHGERTTWNTLRFGWGMAGIILGNVGSALFEKGRHRRVARLMLALGNARGVMELIRSSGREPSNNTNYL